MDDTGASMDVSKAAATRKRRSSILKSQRPPRTPFSELEFNVATPTDTAKSRRVSFSRRTGVAEFATNDGTTTTWMNFYEEHNKSLESSGNETAAKSRQVIEHIGKRIFDQQFEEVEVVEIGGALQTNSDLQTSFSKANVSQELNTNEKLTGPIHHFELSSMTEHQSKVFGDELSVPVMSEMSNPININFSNLNPLGDKCDDLEEIERDLERSLQNNVVCPGPFMGRDMSEYIEIDFNMTQGRIKSDDCDMSITETIQSPTVQTVPKTGSVKPKTDDLIDDKENMVVNPYITPKESENFALNEADDKILVFNGKKLTVQSGSEPLPDSDEKDKYRCLLTDGTAITPQRKTILLNVNDDLPNFVQFTSVDNIQTIKQTGKPTRNTIVFNEGADISITEAIPSNVLINKEMKNNLDNPKRKTIVFDENADISITQGIPSNVLINKEIKSIIENPKRRTIVFDEGADVSITQAIPSNVLINKEMKNNLENPKRRTIVFDEGADISITQGIPSNVLINKENKNNLGNSKRNTIVFDEGGDISITQAIPYNVLINKEINNATIYDNYDNLSITQAVINNIDNKNRKTIVFEEDADISIIQAVPSKIFTDKKISITQTASNKTAKEKRNTIVFDEGADISITQSVPSNIVLDKKNNITIFDNDNNLSMTEAIINNLNNPKRKTIVFGDDGDISITQAVPSKVIIEMEKRKTIIYNNDNNLSITQAVPSNIINDKRKTGVHEEEGEEVMIDKNKTIQDKTTLYQHDNDISITEAIPVNIINNEIDNDNISMTQAIPSNIITNDKTLHKINDNMVSNENDKRRTVFDDNISVTQAIPNIFLDKILDTDNTKRKTVYDNDISMTQAMPSNILQSDRNENMDVSMDDVSISDSPKNIIVDPEENCVYSIVKNNVDDMDIRTKSTRECSQNSNVYRSSISKPIPSNITNLLGDMLKKNNKSVIEENRLIENNHDVLVYQANEAIKLDHLKNIEEDEEQVSESNSVINITNPSDKTKIYGICGIPMIEDKTEENIEYIPVFKEEPSTVDPKPITSESFTIKSPEVNKNIKKSLLNELLDMSCSSIDNVIPEPKISFKLPDDGGMQIKESYEVVDNIESVENEEFIENELLGVAQEPIPPVTSNLPALDYREDSEDVHHLQNQIDNLKVAVEEKVSNRHYEKILSTDLQQSLEQNTGKETNVCRNVKKSFKNADDTNELLEMLSDFTEGNTDEEREECKQHVEKKVEPKRLSFAPNRQSIVLSREDLLNNISMAHAALQRSRFEINESDSIEDTKDFPDESTQEDKKSPKKSVRMSTEVVKTLQFDEDESISDTSVLSEIKASPLKKTAFGEVSYMREDKAKVIPTYLKDVSDNIKALMTDLVKPVSDVLPFESNGNDKSLRQSISTCSTQIQANLVTSSQIDINNELRSNTGSLHSSRPSETMVKEIASMGNKAITQALRNSIKPVNRSVSFDARTDKVPEVKSPKKSLGPVIVFDHTNPLNNIFLTTPDNLKVHRYNPITSDTKPDNKPQALKIESQCEVERVSACFNLETKNQPSLQSGDTGGDVNKINSIISNVSKPVSIDRSIEGFAIQVKHTEVNTVIAMKETNEILEANSSLTLVDDAFGRSAFDIHVGSLEIKPVKKETSPMRVIYKMEDDELLEKIDSDFISADDSVDELKRKKRTYSPTKRNTKTASNLDITPKPVSKMQKMSNSPNPTNMDKSRRLPKNKSSPEKKRKTKVNPKLDLVQKLIASSDIQDVLKQEIIEAISHSSTTTLDAGSVSKTLVEDVKSPETMSYTSSKCATEIQDISSDSRSVSLVGSNMSRVIWQPDLVNEMSSKNMFDECSSGDNVVAKINTLPFIGNRDCEWESSTSDVWMFRLLRSRIRLTIRLAHTHHNATRSRVRADTPIVSLNVDSVLDEESDPLASLVIRLSRDAMRASCSRCKMARDVPRLLRYCAGVARIAPKWARAMRDARARLAYRLGPDGELAFKVANIQLRSVWEVRLRIKLVDDDMDSWPCATDVHVVPVLADADNLPNVDRLTQTLKQDWGHAPAAIWKIFKHLKNKRRADDLLGL